MAFEKEMRKKVPVLVLAFNRADHVAEAMKPVQAYQPNKLYLACDGPRANKEGEKEAVESTRIAMLDAIDWNCDIQTLFREHNLGCAKAVYEAITWFFEQEEYGIIIEDDVIVGMDFFMLCECLLPRYIGQNQIMEISAQNYSQRKDISNTYVYSQCFHCWGWATWRRAWQKMDMSMSAARDISLLYLIKRLGLFRGVMMFYYFKEALMNIASFSSWATRWYLVILHYDGLVICPGVNLAINVGMKGGAHYSHEDVDPYEYLLIGRIEQPLIYNDHFSIDKLQRHFDNLDFLRVRWLGVKKKLRISKIL